MKICPNQGTCGCGAYCKEDIEPSQDDKAVRLDGLSLVMTETGGGRYRLIFEFDNIEAMQSGRDKLAKKIINR